MEILFSEVWTRLRDSAKGRERPGITPADICSCPPAETREGAGALRPGKLQLERDPSVTAGAVEQQPRPEGHSL